MHPFDMSGMDASTMMDGLPLIGAMMTRRNSNDSEEGVTLGALMKRWAHIGVTGVLVTVTIFLWGQYQESSRERQAMQTDIEVLKRITQNIVHQQDLTALEKRIDVHRDQLDTLNAALLNHAARDERTYVKRP